MRILKCVTFLLLLSKIGYGDTTTLKPLITQTIIYKTDKAAKTYLVWKLDNWSTIPEKKSWPQNTFVKDSMVWSKMEGDKDSFSINITLPINTQLDFMFWVPIDRTGDSTDGWDSYGSQTYSSKFNQQKRMSLYDGALWMPEKTKKFTVLEFGWKFLGICALIASILFIVFRERLSFSKYAFITGCLLIAIIIIIMARIEMNDIHLKKPGSIIGAILPDMIWFLSVGVIAMILINLLKKIKWLTTTIFITTLLIIFFSVFFSLINIEIVKFLGRPVNYQWLYYSNFMTGADAKTAVAENLKPKLVLNLILILSGVIIFSTGFSFLPKDIFKKISFALVPLCILILGFGYYQYKTVVYAKGNITNPMWEVISSSVVSQTSSKLFTMKVDPKIKKYIDEYHSQQAGSKIDSSGKIDNIILFVLESVPHHMVSIYDSTYTVTPNIDKWKTIGTVYNNMYSHLPATVYSMATMLAGVYPLINYTSIIANYPKNTIPSIASELKKQDWSSGIFFAADLAYSNMGMYVRNQGFDISEDNTTIPCKFEKFGNTQTFLDQLDDRCLVTRYFEWADSVKNKKKFSMLWTTQTHYSYLFRGKEVDYVQGKKDLNNYLNALQENDIAFGMLMEGLKKRNMLENTLVILTADHGEAFGTHDQVIHATKVYEENVHVPFILYNPILCKQKTNDKLSGLIDVAPSINHLLGLPKPAEWQGKSLFLPGSGNDRVFFLCPFSDFLFGTRTSTWKYIYNGTTDEEELYDLKSDPKELKNVANEHPEVTKLEFEMLAGWTQYQNAKMKLLLK